MSRLHTSVLVTKAGRVWGVRRPTVPLIITPWCALVMVSVTRAPHPNHQCVGASKAGSVGLTHRLQKTVGELVTMLKTCLNLSTCFGLRIPCIRCCS